MPRADSTQTVRRDSAQRLYTIAVVVVPVWCLSITMMIFLERSDARYQDEPSPSMGEGWVGVVLSQYNR